VAFEAFRAESQPRSARGRLTVALSIAFHGALLAAGIAYSFWHVDELTPPSVKVTFLSAAPPPPPPPPPAGGGGAARKKVVVGDLEEDDLLAIVGQPIADLAPQRLGGDALAVQRQLVARVQLDHDGRLAGGQGDVLGLLLRDLGDDLLQHHRRHHHEDDEQHQHHVDERGDVDLRLGAALAVADGEGHLASALS
jgi:hypothetical protein